jgi:hypothetical protein
MHSLFETQEILWRLITAPEGVAQGLADLPDRERVLPGGLESLVRGDERLSAIERLDIYANMYFFRILDCLKEDFPALRAVLGGDRFHNLVTGYLLAHPPSHPSVRFLGRHLASYLADHEYVRERADLSDLAKLEWAILAAFDAADGESLAPERLHQVAAEQWADARFRLTRSLQILDIGFTVDEVWAAATHGREIEDPRHETRTLCVWRQDLRVFHRPIDSTEAAALFAAGRGEDFGALCEIVADRVGEEVAAERAAEMLRRWFADGMIVGIDLSGSL